MNEKNYARTIVQDINNTNLLNIGKEKGKIYQRTISCTMPSVALEAFAESSFTPSFVQKNQELCQDFEIPVVMKLSIKLR